MTKSKSKFNAMAAADENIAVICSQAADIRKWQAVHGALLAVAEAAQALENELETKSPSRNVSQYRSTILERALFALAAVRGESKKDNRNENELDS